jgi:hypothetical protein
MSNAPSPDLSETPTLLQLLKRADQFLDEDQQQKKFVELGKAFYHVFHSGAEPGKPQPVSSQLRNLQQIATTAPRFSEIEAFVKRQMGRGTKDAQHWREVGESILEQLALLRRKAAELTSDCSQQFLLRQHLARGWIRIVVGGYMFEKARTEMGKT